MAAVDSRPVPASSHFDHDDAQRRDEPGYAHNTRALLLARGKDASGLNDFERGHPRPGGATVFGISNDQTFEAEWAAWANGTAVRELDMHDTFLAADYSHPGDNIPPILAVAQQCAPMHGLSGADLVRGILTAYEVQISLVKAICLHEFKKDHIAHLAPAQAAAWCTWWAAPRR